MELFLHSWNREHHTFSFFEQLILLSLGIHAAIALVSGLLLGALIKLLATPPITYMSPDIFGQFEFRKGDVVVCAPVKSGTYWSMQQVYQVLSKGDTSYDHIHDHTAWLEWKNFPEETVSSRIDRINAIDWSQTVGTRIFKVPRTVVMRTREWKRRTKQHFILTLWRVLQTHMHPSPGPLPLDPSVKYVITIRNPLDLIPSAMHFIEGHQDEFFKAMNMGQGPKVFPLDRRCFVKWLSFFRPTNSAPPTTL